MRQWVRNERSWGNELHCLIAPCIASLLKLQFEGPPGVDLERTGCGDASACL